MNKFKEEIRQKAEKTHLEIAASFYKNNPEKFNKSRNTKTALENSKKGLLGESIEK